MSLVVVESYLSLPQAVVAKSLLRAHGLTATLPDAHYASLAWHHLVALNGVRLVVPESDLSQARELLAGGDPDTATPTRFRWRSAILAAVLLVLAGVPFPARQAAPIRDQLSRSARSD